jgi:hypothetical protein
MRISYRLDRGKLPFIGLGIAAGSAALGFGAALDLPPAIPLLVATACYLCAAALALSGVHLRTFSMHREWNAARVEKAIRAARDDVTIRLMQTWIPEREYLFPYLERLLVRENRRFKLEVLLVDPSQSDAPADDLVAARVRLRELTSERARADIVATIEDLFHMKSAVDQARRGKHPDLDLTVKCHRVLPPGPIYQVGGERMFIGFYPPTRSSLHAPMLEIRREDCDYWHTFQQAFEATWRDADTVETVEDGAVVLKSESVP